MNASPIESVVVPATRDLGDGFLVRRALPSAQRRFVGPFVFLDQFGPVAFAPGEGFDVRPHPHIGLATLTYLIEGEIMHRDSLGVVQPIRPGEVNWMSAGRGIVHSERTPASLRATGARLAGLQCWVALPLDHEESEPTFAHHGADELPVDDERGVRITRVAGSFHGRRSPLHTLSPLLFAEIVLQPGARVDVPAQHPEQALYVVEGAIDVEGDARHDAGRLLVARSGADFAVANAGDAPARLAVLGGEPLDAPRHLHWNFVSSSKARIERARDDWRAGRFPRVPGETEFIPLPGDPTPPPVYYP